jgi:hypothetical protein
MSVYISVYIDVLSFSLLDEFYYNLVLGGGVYCTKCWFVNFISICTYIVNGLETKAYDGTAIWNRLKDVLSLLRVFSISYYSL